jgi:hypothetical protein
LNNGGEATGVDACNEYNSFVRATYYSNQSSITTGTTLYLSDYVTVVPDGYYSNGTNYWYFGGGVTSDLGTSCAGSPTPPTPPSPPPTPPSPPPTPPTPSYNTFFLGIGKDNYIDGCDESSYPITVYAPNTPIDYNTTLYDDITFTTPFSALQDYWYKDQDSGKVVQLSSGAVIQQYIQC